MPLKPDGNYITVSNTVPQYDNLNKVNKVKNWLVCGKRDIPFIVHSETIDSSKHLKWENLHLDYNGLRNFTKHFLVFLRKFNWRQQRIRFLSTVNLNSEK